MSITAIQQKAIDTYAKILAADKAMKTAYDAETADRHTQLAKLAGFLEGTVKDVENLPEIIKTEAPEFAWKIGVKNDAFAIECYRALRDFAAESNKKAKDFAELIDGSKDLIGNWLLASLNAAGAKSVNCGASGKAYKKLKVQASATDWDSYLKWVVEKQAFDAIQRRVSSTFVTAYKEEHGEVPPFLNVYREFEIVVSK